MEEKNNIKLAFICQREGTIPIPVETTTKNGFVNFGEDNLYPQHIYSYYENCSILQSIVNGMVDYISGVGFSDELNKKTINSKGETLSELLKKITLDYIIFGQFGVQVLKNPYNEVVELYWVDNRKIRLDEDGEKVYFNNWGKRKNKAKVYPRWFKNSTEKNSIYIYKNPLCRETYGLPIWGSAIKDVQTFIQISTFHLNNILNNFAGSAVVNFNNGVPDEETQRDIERRLNDKFSGASNGGKTIVSFNDSKENAVSIERLAEDNLDTKYAQLYNTTKANIFIAFRAIPQLFGCDPERTGFNSVEYEQSFKLYKKTMITPRQREIEKFFKDVLNITEPLKEFEISFDNNEQTQTTTNENNLLD